jgi:RimJ/RimL family protein N-acetyltransferase
VTSTRHDDMPIDFDLPIEGEKVVIRKLSEDDLDPMYDLESDPCVKRYLDDPVKKPREQWIAAMRDCLNSTSMLAVTCKASDDFAGRASLTRPIELWHPALTAEALVSWQSCREVRAVIAKKYWGHHLGREVCQLLVDVAFDRLKSSSVVGLVHPGNKWSLKLCECLGFRQEKKKMDDGRIVCRLSNETPRIWRSDVARCP